MNRSISVSVILSEDFFSYGYIVTHRTHRTHSTIIGCHYVASSWSHEL